MPPDGGGAILGGGRLLERRLIVLHILAFFLKQKKLMGNSCPAHDAPSECDETIDCDNGWDTPHANPECRLRLCPSCDRTLENSILNSECKYLLHPLKNKDVGCFDYERRQLNKINEPNKCATIQDYTNAGTRVENAINSETKFNEEILTKQNSKQTSLDAKLQRADAEILTIQNRMNKKQSNWLPLTYCNRLDLFRLLHPKVAIVASRFAAAKAKDKYMR